MSLNAMKKAYVIKMGNSILKLGPLLKINMVFQINGISLLAMMQDMFLLSSPIK